MAAEGEGGMAWEGVCVCEGVRERGGIVRTGDGVDMC